MLSFRATQVEAIWFAQFSERMAAHLVEYFPSQCALAGDGAVQATIRLSVQRARAHGLRLEASAQSFLDHMLMLGSGFDADPLLPWAQQLLNGTTQELPKLDALHARAVRIVDRAEDGSRPWLSALERVRREGLQLDLATLPSAALLQVASRFQELFPAKASALPAALPGVVERTELVAREGGWATPLALTRVMGLQLLLGTGVLTDPMLSWVTQPLRAAELTPDARAQLLWRNFERFADAVLLAASDEREKPAESTSTHPVLRLRSA